MRSPPAPTGGVRSTRRPRLQFACPVLCGQYLTRGNGHLCVSISSWAQEVRLHTVQPPQLGATPPHPPGRPRRGGRSVCAGQVRRLRDGSTSRPLATGGARDAIATGSPPRLRHPLRPPCVIQGGDFRPTGGGGFGLAYQEHLRNDKCRHTQTEALARGRTGCELRPTLAVHKLRPWEQAGKVVDSRCTQTEALLRADYRCVKSTTF